MDFDRLADVNTVKPALNWQYIYSYKNGNGYDNFDSSAVYQVIQELYHRHLTYGMLHTAIFENCSHMKASQHCNFLN